MAAPAAHGRAEEDERLDLHRALGEKIKSLMRGESAQVELRGGDVQ